MLCVGVALAAWISFSGCDSGAPAPNATPGGPGATTGPEGPPTTPGAGQQTSRSGAATTASGESGDSGEFAAAKKIFQANCARCHTIGEQMAGGPGGSPGGPGAGFPGPGGPQPGGPGPGGPPPGGRGPGAPFGPRGMMPRGPDLGKAGANPEHTVEWLMAFIKNPKAGKPQSRMPPFEGKLSEDDLKAIAEYLASFK
ncbi:MAG: c-type cytochrome [Deltaproteobacteria bacterium]